MAESKEATKPKSGILKKPTTPVTTTTTTRISPKPNQLQQIVQLQAIDDEVEKRQGSSGSVASRTRTRFSSPDDEYSSRQSAASRAREFIHTPEKKPVKIHQFYADISNEYKVQPGIVFYDEDTEEEDEEQEEAVPQGHGQGEERPESVLTDVTIDGLGDQDIGDMPGVQVIPRHKMSVMSLSTVDEKQAIIDDSMENVNNNALEEAQESKTASGQATHTPGPSRTTSDNLFSTAVDEDMLENARTRVDAAIDTRPQLQRIMVDKLRSTYYDGLGHKANKNYRDAIRCFTKVITLKPESIAPYVQRAECHLFTCDFQSAITNYKKVCCMDSTNSSYYNRLAFIYYLQGQCLFDSQLYTEALEAFTQATEMKPDNESYHTRSIACLAALERHGECLALVNKRLDQEKHNADLYVMRSRLNLMFKNIALCYYDIKDALSVNPEHKEAREMMASFVKEAQEKYTAAVQLNLQGRHRDALQKISSAIEYDPSQAKFHVIRGALHRTLRDFNSAVDDYLLALDKTNHDEESTVYLDAQRQLLLTYNDFAIECFKKGFYQESVILLNKALKGEKREKGLYVNRGDCFFRMNDYHFALADYHQALEMDPSDDFVRSRISIIHNEYGTLDYQNKKYSESESRFTLAIRNNPKISQYYVSRARARYMLESHGGARTDLLTALHLNPNQDAAISLTSRLFPGKTMDEIMSSGASMAVKKTLAHVLASHGDRRLTPLTSHSVTAHGNQIHPWSHDSQSGNCNVSYIHTIRVYTRNDKHACTLPDWLKCIGMDQGMNKAEARHEKIKQSAQLKYRQCLQEEDFNRILTDNKKTVANKVKSALNDRQSLRNELPFVAARVATTNANDLKTPATGWRNFSQGISVRDAS